ncbi:DUF4974 domain-containing protein [Pedobacter sp. BS3]|uniref:FecR family protein n=1 Tax=Pedobacter sp. BS3 TaxID=2567937 RepID=UPI0011EDFFFE|nr:FecR domain-containing protein [Pedobacter sp. BS3]TZF81099.1 DUF4974 domain-containing protein [Pedobacter sp. BS3]
MTSDYEHIRQLFMEKLAGTLSPADELRLQQLLNADERNRALWQSLEKQSANIGAGDFLDKLDTEHDLSAIRKTIQQRSVKRIRPWVISAAAMLLVVLGISSWFLLVRKNQPEKILAKNTVKSSSEHVQLLLENGEAVTLDKTTKHRVLTLGNVKFQTSGNTLQTVSGSNPEQLTTLSVPVKEDFRVTLSDGTKVWLNSISKLRFPVRFTGKTREVYLEGEAYLEVVKDAQHPFIVHTEQSDIRVLGTKFNVNTYQAGSMKTSLVEGSVLLTAKNGSATKLSPGYQSVYTKDGFKTTSFDADEVLSWMDGVYYFQHVQLKELEPVISRWFGLNVAFDNPALGDIRLSGMIEKQQLTGFLKDLETSSDIQYTISGNVLHLK